MLVTNAVWPSGAIAMATGLCSDPLLAAHHLAGLVMWMPRNLLTFCPDASFTTRKLEQLLESAVRAFLVGYGTP
jgi:hypothetical protein